MANTCSNCGKETADNTTLCPECSKPAKAQEEKPEGKFAPVSVGTFFLYLILFSIPVVNLITCIILCFAPKRQNLKNFARASLIVFIIELIVAALIVFGLISLGKWAVANVETIVNDTSEVVVTQVLKEIENADTSEEGTQKIVELLGGNEEIAEKIEGVQSVIEQFGGSEKLLDALGGVENIVEQFGGAENLVNQIKEGELTIPENFTLPETFTFPENFTLPKSIKLPDNIIFPEGIEIPESIKIPENVEIPEGITLS